LLARKTASPETLLPTSTASITGNNLLAILRAALPDGEIFISDNDKYFLCSYDDIALFLAQSQLDKTQYVAELYDCEVPEDVAYGLGLFYADGSCGTREGKLGGAWWRVVGRKLDCLERAQVAFNKEWQDMLFYPKLYDSYRKGVVTNLGTRTQDTYCLEVSPRVRHNNGSRGQFIELFRNTLYNDNKEKRVPSGILESPAKTKLAFLEGVIDGDGTTKGNRGCITCHGMLSVYGLMDLMLDCGWTFHFKPDHRNDNYSLYYNRKNEKLVEQPACDDFALALAGEFSIPGWSALALGIMWTSTHAFNIFVDESEKIWFLEPQTDDILPIEDYMKTKTNRFLVI